MILKIIDRQIRDHWLQTGKFPKKLALTEGQHQDLLSEIKKMTLYPDDPRGHVERYKGILVEVVEVI